MTQTFTALDATTLIAPQIRLDSLAGLAATGVSVVVSHRPDDEEPGQPSAADVSAAAAAAGLRFVHAPCHGMPDAAVVAETRAVLEGLEAGDRALMFCRSGTRSVFAWALAMRSLDRADADSLRASAAAAGYDISRLPL